MGGGGGGGWCSGLVGSCAFSPFYQFGIYGMELNPLSSPFFFLSSYSMARGQEKTSTSQAWRRRGPTRDTPSASSLVSSLSMEELRSYCRIPNNIDFELLDSPAKSTIDEDDNVVYFTRE